MKRRLLILVSILGLVGGTVAGSAGIANAYPPGKHMTVSAHPSVVRPGGRVNVVAHRVQPGCQVRFTLGSDTAVSTANAGGVARAHLTAPSSTGPKTVTATSFNCTNPETATTQIFVGKPHVEVVPSNVEHGDTFAVHAEGFPANHKITIFISLHGKTVASKKTTTDSQGRADASFTLSKKGSYLAVATTGNAAAAEAFRVTK